MKKISGLLILFILIASCKKNSTVYLSGTYMGTYRQIAIGIDSTVTVRIIFNGNRFSGEGDTSNFPKICEGTYHIDGSQIQFHNDCYAPGDSLDGVALSGDYENNLKGDSLFFGRAPRGIVYQAELYYLKKQ